MAKRRTNAMKALATSPPVDLVILAVSDDLDTLASLAERLRGAGVSDLRLDGSLGTIFGRALPGIVESLKEIDGVASVERARRLSV